MDGWGWYIRFGLLWKLAGFVGVGGRYDRPIYIAPDEMESVYIARGLG